jgi:hypothetical protein
MPAREILPGCKGSRAVLAEHICVVAWEGFGAVLQRQLLLAAVLMFHQECKHALLLRYLRLMLRLDGM